VHADVAIAFGDLGRVGTGLVYGADHEWLSGSVAARTDAYGIADHEVKLAAELLLDRDSGDLLMLQCRCWSSSHEQQAVQHRVRYSHGSFQVHVRKSRRSMLK
jgi:hypothetical protein